MQYVLNQKLKVKIRIKTFYWLLELLHTAFVSSTTTNMACFAPSFCISWQQLRNVSTGIESLKPCIPFLITLENKPLALLERTTPKDFICNFSEIYLINCSVITLQRADFVAHFLISISCQRFSPVFEVFFCHEKLHSYPASVNIFHIHMILLIFIIAAFFL